MRAADDVLAPVVGRLAAVVGDDLGDLLGRDAREDAVVDEQGRALVAHAHAARPLEGEDAVVGGVAEVDAQGVAQRFGDGRLAGEVARQRAAEPHDEAALGRAVQEGVERGDAVDLDGVHADQVGDDLHGLVGDLVLGLLDVLQDGDERRALGAVALDDGDDLVARREVGMVSIARPPTGPVAR